MHLYLYLYLVTTAYVWVDTIGSMIRNDLRLKKEGYKFTGKRFSGVGDIVICILFAISMSIPVLKFIFPLSNIDKESAYDDYKNMLLEAGYIEEPEVKVEVKKDVANNNVIKKTINKVFRPINNELDYEKEKEEGHGRAYRKEFINRRQ